MVFDDTALLALLIFLAAALYSTVGHAGASGYIAAMAVVGLSPLVMKPTALTLNVLVASLATIRLWRAGLINLRALAPLVLVSVPLAFVGGAVQLPVSAYRMAVGVVLLAAGLRLLIDPREKATLQGGSGDVRIPLPAALVAGGAIGLLSGLTGTGGGIFLSPLLLLLGWAGARQAAGMAAPFILVNSIAGLAGNIVSLQSLPAELPVYAGAALLGALLGTQLAIRWLPVRLLQFLLGAVLLVAAVKLILT
jgi:uncharacterized membrane protein YfcA